MSAGRRYRRSMQARRISYVLPEIPDDAPAAFKDGLAIRNTATVTGICPGCGSERDPLPPFVPGSVSVLNFSHEDGCPALMDAFL